MEVFSEALTIKEGKMSEESKNYKGDSSGESFWEKFKRFAIKAGKEAIEKALLLYYAARSPKTPAWAKTTCYGALGYFISPIDAIPDITPVVGFADDLGVLVLALTTVAAYIDQKVRDKATSKMKSWFGEE
jgi:uncharacterized membrane protein YkvA (DUF1232 family)